MTSRRHLVINAINLSVGGGRTVLRDFLGALRSGLPEDMDVTCFVRRDDDLPPDSRIGYVIPRLPHNTWLARLWFEAIGLSRAVAGRQVNAFVSLQGSGARVEAHRRFVYCHNALPMVAMSPGLLGGAGKLRLMRRVYDLLYRFTIRPNDWLIVQQEWVRDAFRARYGHGRTVVAHPVHAAPAVVEPDPALPRVPRSGPFRLLFPLAAHPYKNAQVACEAAMQLETAYPGRFELLLTIRGDETPYAAALASQYRSCSAIRFIGQLVHDRLLALYGEVDLLLFPSMVETWGLPISEAKEAGLPILAANLPYAHETVGNYSAAGFFDPLDAVSLTEAIHGCWSGKRPLGAVSQSLPAEPFAPDWTALVAFVTADRARTG